jgi:hypothetical protein
MNCQNYFILVKWKYFFCWSPDQMKDQEPKGVSDSEHFTLPLHSQFSNSLFSRQWWRKEARKVVVVTPCHLLGHQDLSVGQSASDPLIFLRTKEEEDEDYDQSSLARPTSSLQIKELIQKKRRSSNTLTPLCPCSCYHEPLSKDTARP